MGFVEVKKKIRGRLHNDSGLSRTPDFLKFCVRQFKYLLSFLLILNIFYFCFELRYGFLLFLDNLG
jgi:hypothetical protein